MRRSIYFMLAAILVSVVPCVQGQDQAAIQKALTSQFVLTKTTADGSDIVTPGSILVLHKDGLQMFSIATKIPPTITYKDGKLGMGFGDAFGTDMALSAAHKGANVSNVPQRKFVAGEKFWITAFLVKDKYVILQVYSDPYQDVRYFGQLKFPYNKKSIPSADDLLKTIAEVMTVEPADNSAGGAAQPQAATRRLRRSRLRRHRPTHSQLPPRPLHWARQRIRLWRASGNRKRLSIWALRRSITTRT